MHPAWLTAAPGVPLETVARERAAPGAPLEMVAREQAARGAPLETVPPAPVPPAPVPPAPVPLGPVPPGQPGHARAASGRPGRRRAALIAVVVTVVAAAVAIPVWLITGSPPATAGHGPSQGPRVSTQATTHVGSHPATTPGHTHSAATQGPSHPAATQSPSHPARTPGPSDTIPASNLTLRAGNDNGLFGLAFSPDGRHLVAGGGNGSTTYVWDITTSQLTTLHAGPGAFFTTAIAASPNGKLVAAVCLNDAAYLWNLATGQLTATLTSPNQGGDPYAVAFSPNSTLLATGEADNRTDLWDIATGSLTKVLKDASPIQGLAFSPDGTLLAAAGRPTFLWDVATGQRYATLYDPGGRAVQAVAFSRDGKLVVAGDDNGSAYLWNVATGTLAATLTAPGTNSNDYVTSVAFSPDDQIVATADSNGHAYLWNVATHALVGTFTDPGLAARRRRGVQPERRRPGHLRPERKRIYPGYQPATGLASRRSVRVAGQRGRCAGRIPRSRGPHQMGLFGGLRRIGGRGGGIPASGRGSPPQDAWARLFEFPSLALLTPMVVPAQRGQIAFAGQAALVPGQGVVQVAPRSGPPAARRGAPGVADLDQVGQGPAGPVPALGPGVVAVAAGHRGHPDPQPGQVVPRRGSGGRVRAGRAAAGRGAGWRVRAGRAARIGGPGVAGRRVRALAAGPAAGGGGWRPRAQPCAAAVPSGWRAVTHHRVSGCRAAAATELPGGTACAALHAGTTTKALNNATKPTELRNPLTDPLLSRLPLTSHGPT